MVYGFYCVLFGNCTKIIGTFSRCLDFGFRPFGLVVYGKYTLQLLLPRKILQFIAAEDKDTFGGASDRCVCHLSRGKLELILEAANKVGR